MKKLRYVLLIVISTPIFLCCFGASALIIYDHVPNYPNMPVEPPINDHVEIGRWENINCIFKDAIIGRYSICVGESLYQIGNDEKETINIIEKNFDSSLQKTDWIRNEKYSPCQQLMEGLNVLDKGNNNATIIHYRRKGYIETYDYVEEELICVSLQRKEIENNYMNIIILGMRPSVLMQLSQILS